MAWRIAEYVLDGELDNTTRNWTTGWIRLLGRNEPLQLKLVGNCHPDLAGWRFQIVRIIPSPDLDSRIYSDAESSKTWSKLTGTNRDRMESKVFSWARADMIEFRYTGDALYARMERAVERVTQRLRKTVETLESAGIRYAVVGGHAVRAWVAQVDEAAVRNTRDVAILVRPEDLPAIIEAMTGADFHYRQISGLDMFVEDPDASARDAVHIVLAKEMVRPNDVEPNPDVEPLEVADGFKTIPLAVLVRMKLNSNRDKDRVHVRDMISLGMVDESWPATLPPELGRRLQTLLDDPDG